MRSADSAAEELLIAHLCWGRGLPASQVEIRAIQEMRARLKIEVLLPPPTDEFCLGIRAKLLNAQEIERWAKRDRDIREIQVRSRYGMSSRPFCVAQSFPSDFFCVSVEGTKARVGGGGVADARLRREGEGALAFAGKSSCTQNAAKARGLAARETAREGPAPGMETASATRAPRAPASQRGECLEDSKKKLRGLARCGACAEGLYAPRPFHSTHGSLAQRRFRTKPTLPLRRKRLFSRAC